MKPTYLNSRQFIRIYGFTLMEMLITVTIAGILASIALPSFRSFILSQRVKTTTNDVYAALILARSEAMKRNATATVDQTSGSWSKGWTVNLAGGTTTILTQTVPDNITVRELNGLTSIGYSWTGRPITASVGTNFVVSATGITARCVSLSLSGMPQVKVDTDSNASNGC